MSRFSPRTQLPTFLGRIFGSDNDNRTDDLDSWLITTLKRELKTDAIERDEDGDIPIQSGSALVFVHSDDEASCITVFAALIEDFAMRPEVYEAANAINRKIPFAKAIVDPDINQILLLAELHIFDGLSPEQLMATIDLVAETADHYDTLLQKRFGGKTMLDDAEEGEFDV